MKQPIVWTIAGSDTSSGAGIAADLKTFHSLGVYGCAIITAVTAQNHQKINSIQFVSGESVELQMQSLEHNYYPNAIKIGMLGNKVAIKKMICYLRRYTGSVVLDPVLTAASGIDLFSADIKNYLPYLNKIFSLVDIITPNISEAEKILGRNILSYQDVMNAAHDILSLGAKNVLIKGGHIHDNQFSQDYWTNGNESFWLSSKRYAECNYRGTGCVLSSAITAGLALGYDIKDSIVIAKMFINRGIRLAEIIDVNFALLTYSSWPENEIDLPYITSQPIENFPEKFIECKVNRLGLYPVVDSLSWVKKLLPLGVKTIQLRIKNKNGLALEEEIKESIHYAKQYQAQLFINDYWEMALKHGAYGVHLGQDDINIANITMLRHNNLRLGISTHCYYEVARAHFIRPSYLACGPIFHTTSKIMPFAPLGIAQLERWRRTLTYPLVAIGGIGLSNISNVLHTDVNGIAMISAITKAENPTIATQQLLKKVDEYVAKT